MEAADIALEKGILMFYMMIKPDQMTRDEFFNILTCFKCYPMEDRPTKNCQERRILCSECAQEGHRWTECRNPVKKCLNCNGKHRTLTMSCPVKRELISSKSWRKNKRNKLKELNQIVQ